MFINIVKLFSIIIASLLINKVYGFLCPHNMYSVDKGFTVEQVIQQCGVPENQKEYQQILEQPVMETTTRAPVVSHQSYQGPTRKPIITTKLFYGPPHPSVFIFEDRKLINKVSESTHNSLP